MKIDISGSSLAVLWLELWAFTAESLDSIPVWGPKILQAEQHGQKKIHLVYNICISYERILVGPFLLYLLGNNFFFF